MSFFHWFYVQPMGDVYLEMFLMFSAWTIFTIPLKGKVKRIIGAVFAALSVAVIVYMTVLDRSAGEHMANFIPFYTFEAAKIQPELYRTMAMNVFLFMPLGMSLPFALVGKKRYRLIIVVLAALLLSCAIEAVQFSLARGMCDIDDVICNVLGAFLGYWSFYISERISDFIKRHNEKRAR